MIERDFRTIMPAWADFDLTNYLFANLARGGPALDDDPEFDEEDDSIPLISGSGEGIMDEAQHHGAGSRRNEDIALDLMKFIAMTTGYGKTAISGGVGFTGGGSAAKPEDFASHLLELYGKCLGAVAGKK